MAQKKILLPGIREDLGNYINVLEELGAQVILTETLQELEQIFGPLPALLPGTEKEADAFFSEALRSSHGEYCPFDGLLVPGGGDIDPAWYGQENLASRTIDPAIDRLQMTALRLFVCAGKPVLGVCNGNQMINICFGGDLIQDLGPGNRHEKHGKTDSYHGSVIMEHSWLYGLYGKEARINSAHHQAVDHLGKGLEICQVSDDGVVEAIVHRELPVLGVQWHPERMVGKGGEKVYRYFLELTDHA